MSTSILEAEGNCVTCDFMLTVKVHIIPSSSDSCATQSHTRKVAYVEILKVQPDPKFL